MHPLPTPPPPPSSSNNAESQQPGPARPLVSPLQDTSAAGQQSIQSASQATSQGKKKKRHRPKKKQKARRQSFAAPSDASSVPAAMAETVAEQARLDRSNGGARQSAYRLGQPGTNMSSTSLDSEALLDHRDQPMMRPRRESRFGQPPPFMGRRSGSSPKDTLPSAFSREHKASVVSPGNHRRQRAFSKTRISDGEESDGGLTPNDKTPLISRSTRTGLSPEPFGDGGHFGAPWISSNKRRDSNSTRSSRKLRSRPDRETSFLRNEHAEYDVNNPPSVPSSPAAGAEIDDIMFAGADFNLAHPPSRRETYAFGNDAVIDMDPRSQSLPENGADSQPLGTSRSKSIALPVEGDVCFPNSGMSEIAEEDDVCPDHDESHMNDSRRRRHRMWPDLDVLDDWSLSERMALHEEIRVKKVSEPVLVGGRLRPSGQGWHRTEEDSPYRYTYFNEEFESTIHAQTISELVPPGSSFKELFIPDPPELEADSSNEDEEETPPVRESNGDKSSSSPNLQDQTEKISDPGTASLLSELRFGSKDSSRQHSGRGTPQANNSTKELKPKRYGSRPTFWLDVLCPTNDEMRVLAKAFGIHGLTVEDIMMQETREKVELFRNYYFINYRTFEQDKEDVDYLEPVNIYIIVFGGGVLSFHFSQTPHPANVRRRIRQLKDYLILSADWISYAIIDDITDAFQPLNQSIEQEVDYIDEKILQIYSDTIGSPSVQTNNEKRSEAGEDNSPGIDMLRQVGNCRKKVMGLYRLLGNKADVIKGFAKRCTEQWDVAPKSEIGLYLGDIQDHILTMTSNLSHYETLLSRAHSNYLAQITIRMNERQEQSADILGKLTVMGTIVLPMNIICGMWGMNVKVPGQDIDSLTWFWCITAGLILFAIICMGLARRVYGIV